MHVGESGLDSPRPTEESEGEEFFLGLGGELDDVEGDAGGRVGGVAAYIPAGVAGAGVAGAGVAGAGVARAVGWRGGGLGGPAAACWRLLFRRGSVPGFRPVFGDGVGDGVFF